MQPAKRLYLERHVAPGFCAADMTERQGICFHRLGTEGWSGCVPPRSRAGRAGADCGKGADSIKYSKNGLLSLMWKKTVSFLCKLIHNSGNQDINAICVFIRNRFSGKGGWGNPSLGSKDGVLPKILIDLHPLRLSLEWNLPLRAGSRQSRTPGLPAPCIASDFFLSSNR